DTSMGFPMVQRSCVLNGACGTVRDIAMPADTAIAPPGFNSVLATADQRAAEQMVLRIMADPRVQAARDRARGILEANPLAQLPDGKAQLDHALEAWTSFLAFQEANADPAHPLVVWTPTNSANTWFGHTVPAAGGSIDNPDNIYRHVPIDASA